MDAKFQNLHYEILGRNRKKQLCFPFMLIIWDYLKYQLYKRVIVFEAPLCYYVV